MKVNKIAKQFQRQQELAVKAAKKRAAAQAKHERAEKRQEIHQWETDNPLKVIVFGTPDYHAKVSTYGGIAQQVRDKRYDLNLCPYYRGEDVEGFFTDESIDVLVIQTTLKDSPLGITWPAINEWLDVGLTAAVYVAETDESKELLTANAGIIRGDISNLEVLSVFLCGKRKAKTRKAFDGYDALMGNNGY